MVGQIKSDSVWLNLGVGAVTQMLEALTLGQPFEVWKTRMGMKPKEKTFESLVKVYEVGGLKAFWAGIGAKMIECALKGAILMIAKEAINDGCLGAGMGPGFSGLLAGFGGGIAQVTVMGPTTFLITSAVGGESISTVMKQTLQSHGIKGFYPGGVAIAMRQATNWASRQGITEYLRDYMMKRDGTKKITTGQEIMAGAIGGALSCWNQPFEVARIQAQKLAREGVRNLNMIQVMQKIVAENGLGGLYQGVVPRMGLGIWQTLFMVTGAKIIKNSIIGGSGPVKH